MNDGLQRLISASADRSRTGRMLPRARYTALVCALTCCGAALESRGDDAEIPRPHHAWARFAPGSWKLVRIVTENYGPDGQVSAASVTETKTTLKETGATGFTLQVESTVELDGKRIVSEPQQVTQGYNGALAGQTAHARVVGAEEITIDGKSFPCRVLQYDIGGAGHKTVTRTHYSADTAPYVLRRETTAVDTTSNLVSSRVLVEVKELNVPHTACGQTLQAARVRVQQKHAKGAETTEALSCVRVPGGVIWHDSTLVDGSGKKLSHSKLELIDFHVEPREGGASQAYGHLLPTSLHARHELCNSYGRAMPLARSRYSRCGH